MANYHENALEIIKDNFLYYLNRETKTFAINVRLYEVSHDYMNIVFDGNKDKPFIQFDGPPITYSDLIEMLGDMESEESLYVLISESIFKNYISVFEDYLKDILEYLFNKYPHHIFQRKEKIELSKLIEYNSLEELKDRIIREKVISLSYNNLAEMIEFIEQKFKVDLNIEPIVLDSLIELTLIRNILVHNKGIVNERFMEKMKGKAPNYIDGIYDLGVKIIMSPHEMTETHELLTRIGDHIFKKLKNKFESKQEQ